MRTARDGLAGMGPAVRAYTQALAALDKAAAGVTGADRSALQAAVTGGRAEVLAVMRMRGVLAGVWPAYSLLNANEDVWTSHAVSGWYRTTKEAADAYAVLALPGRPALEAARSRLAEGAAALSGPSIEESMTLDAADRTLQHLRQP